MGPTSVQTVTATMSRLENFSGSDIVCDGQSLLVTKHNTPPPCFVSRSLRCTTYLPEVSIMGFVTDEFNQLSVTDTVKQLGLSNNSELKSQFILETTSI